MDLISEYDIKTLQCTKIQQVGVPAFHLVENIYSQSAENIKD